MEAIVVTIYEGISPTLVGCCQEDKAAVFVVEFEISMQLG